MEWSWTRVPGKWPGHRVGKEVCFVILRTYYGGNPMAPTASRLPSQTDGSGSIAVATWNIHNDRNGGLESALRAMEALDAALGSFLETKVTSGIYTLNSSGHSIVPLDAPFAQQGGIAVFWQANKMYEVEDWRICGPNVLPFVIVTESQCFYDVGCYIPPTDLSTLPQVKQALNKCPKGHTPSYWETSTSIYVPCRRRETNRFPKWWKTSLG